MNKSVKEWYVSEFPLDKMGAGIYDDITFGIMLVIGACGGFVGIAHDLKRELNNR